MVIIHGVERWFFVYFFFFFISRCELEEWVSTVRYVFDSSLSLG